MAFLVPAALLVVALAAELADAGAATGQSGSDAAVALPEVDAGAAARPQLDGGAPDAAAKARRAFKGERRAPVALLTYLRKQTVGEWCPRASWGAPAALEAERLLELRDGSLLFFAQVPNYLCSSSNRAVPVVVSAKGDWRWGAPIEGLVTRLARSEDGTLWASTQWQIEGTYPALYRSRDGVSWKEVALPEERATRGPFEELATLCFGYRTVVVKIVQLDDTNPSAAVEVWSRDRKGEGAWAREPQGIDGGCLPPLPAFERWARDASEDDRVLFLKEGGKQVVSLPKLLRPY